MNTSEQLLHDALNDEFALYLRDLIDDIDDKIEKVTDQATKTFLVAQKAIATKIRTKYFELKR